MQPLRARRRWIAVGATVLVIGGGATGAWALTRSSGTSATTATTSYVAATVGDVSQTVTTTGTIEPAQDSDLTFATSGTITSVAAVVGKKVAKGTVLATVDSTTQKTAVSTATAAVTAAEQELASLSSSTSTQITAAKAQVAAAKTSLAQAQDDLAATSLTAPFTGTVAAVTYAVGDTVGGQGAGAQGATSSSITLITTNAWLVNASVGSADLARLKKGLQAVITPTGATTRVFGTIRSLGIVATSSTSGSATFPVVIDVTGSPAGLYAGSSADVSLVISQLSNVLTIPTLALHTVDGKTVVYKKVGGKKVTTPVTIGTSFGLTTQVLSGLTSGDEVEITFGGFGRTRRTTGGTGSTGGAGTGPTITNDGGGGTFQGPPPGFGGNG